MGGGPVSSGGGRSLLNGEHAHQEQRHACESDARTRPGRTPDRQTATIKRTSDRLCLLRFWLLARAADGVTKKGLSQTLDRRLLEGAERLKSIRLVRL